MWLCSAVWIPSIAGSVSVKIQKYNLQLEFRNLQINSGLVVDIKFPLESTALWNS